MSSGQQYTVDFAIIGGGVAGSSAAITLQRAGYAVAIIEREPVFRDRVRGEACHPWGVRELRELGLDRYVEEAGGLVLPNWSRYRDRQLEMSFAWADVFADAPPELGFSHPKLQDVLLQGAADHGALVYRPARAEIARQAKGWILQIEHADALTTLNASFLIAADGKNSSTRKLWGAEMISDPAYHQFGGMLVEKIDLDQSSAHQGYHSAGFSMVFPQGDDRWRLYYVCPTDEARAFSGDNRVHDFIAACAATLPEGVCAETRAAGPLAFFPNNHVGTSRIHGPHAVAIGDAAGAGDPSQGHGMSLVWRDVRVLRDVLAQFELDEAPAEFARQRRQYEHVLRSHAAWVAPLTTGTDEQALALQAQVELARAADSSALGFAGIFANGPDFLPTDEASRAIFFGENLSSTPVRIETPLDKFE